MSEYRPAICKGKQVIFSTSTTESEIVCHGLTLEAFCIRTRSHSLTSAAWSLNVLTWVPNSCSNRSTISLNVLPLTNEGACSPRATVLVAWLFGFKLEDPAEGLGGGAVAVAVEVEAEVDGAPPNKEEVGAAGLLAAGAAPAGAPNPPKREEVAGAAAGLSPASFFSALFARFAISYTSQARRW
jgi:hypothetical protein